MRIPVILGTARVGRQSEKVAEWMKKEIEAVGIETEIIDVRNFRTEASDNTKQSGASRRLVEKISLADAVIIVSPEYNHGYPGELKMMLDLLYEEYLHKPVGICGVSSGSLGGARVVEQLRQVVAGFGMLPAKDALYFSKVTELFDGEGKILDGSYKGRVKKLLDELMALSKAAKSL